MRTRLPALAFCLALLACRPDGATPQPQPQPRLVLLYAPCTVSRSHLAPYADVAFTPNLARFARESVVFERHYTEAGTSAIAYASLFSGSQADRHGVYRQPLRLPEELELMAETFAAAGYETWFWSRHASASPEIGYGQGVAPDHTFHRRLDAADPAFLRLLDRLERDPDARAYVQTNFTVSHGPYPAEHLEEFLASYPEEAGGLDRERTDHYAALYQRSFLALSYAFPSTLRRLGLDARERAELIASVRLLYRSDLHHLDRLFGAVLEAIDARGLGDQSLVVFTADHGEALYREGVPFPWSHSYQLEPEVIRVPLLMRLPERAARRYPGTTRSIDVYPTLAALAGIALPPEARLDGVDLSESVRGRAPPSQRTAMAHSSVLAQLVFAQMQRSRPHPVWRQLRRLFPSPDAEDMWVALAEGDVLYRLWRPDGVAWRVQELDLSHQPPVEVFDAEPARHREVAERLEAYKAELLAAHPSAAAARERELESGDAAERLRSLGYIE